MSHNFPLNHTRRRKLFVSYIPDWLLTILLAGAFFSLDAVERFRRSFSLTDTSIGHGYAVHERIPDEALFAICFAAPLTLMPIINFLTIRTLWDWPNSSLGLILSLSLTGAITMLMKNTAGRPRPDLISRCNPPPDSVDPEFGLSNSSICRQTNVYIMRDGFRSFPSGHSSLSFAGLGFSAFYLAGKLHLFDRRGHTGKAWLFIAPFTGAGMVALSRTMDNRHHWQDVLAGSILGTIVAYFSYRQYYPHLASSEAHSPFSPRIAREDDEGELPISRRTTLTSNRRKLDRVWREGVGQDEERGLLTDQDDETHEMTNMVLPAGERPSWTKQSQGVDVHAENVDIL
ncbi:PAP2-domain-containing protein [Flagelloscypha sp. PMI_526]|nr:PAP2-domain-containing protein [Flagelloscypha sp. PMI_526]